MDVYGKPMAVDSSYEMVHKRRVLSTFSVRKNFIGDRLMFLGEVDSIFQEPHRSASTAME